MGPIKWITESLKQFKSKNEKLTADIKNTQGEGYETLDGDMFSANSASSFNFFHSSYINQQFKTEIARIQHYRSMAVAPEISNVIEDAANEATQENTEGEILKLEILDEKLAKKEAVVKLVNDEFKELFYNRVNIDEVLFDQMYQYFIDGRIYFENIINTSKPKDGIQGIKTLPTETMDFIYDKKTNRVDGFIQYIKVGIKKPKTIEEASKSKDVIAFYPPQISFIPYQYGRNKQTIIGFLEKCKIPYNQLKLLETAVVIYRIVRAPERFVFKIDVGNMPRDKALKYVEKVKSKMNQKQSFDPDTGTLINSSSILSTLDNFFIPQGENRGADIETIGGNSTSWTELDDIYYFSKKLYQSLKYPLSRIENVQEKSSGDNLFGGSSFGEITRDEIKWAKFLERQQKKFTNCYRDLFLLHMDFKGLKSQYGLNKDNITLKLMPPSNYKEQAEQNLQETRFNNYMALANEPEFSKYFLMKHFLKWDDDQIKENADSKEKDKKYKFNVEEEGF